MLNTSSCQIDVAPHEVVVRPSVEPRATFEAHGMADILFAEMRGIAHAYHLARDNHSAEVIEHLVQQLEQFVAKLS